MTAVSHALRSSASSATTRLSQTAAVNPTPRTVASSATSPIKATASANHHLPEAFRLRGNGGGSPDGRRWTRPVTTFDDGGSSPGRPAVREVDIYRCSRRTRVPVPSPFSSMRFSLRPTDHIDTPPTATPPYSGHTARVLYKGSQ